MRERSTRRAAPAAAHSVRAACDGRGTSTDESTLAKRTRLAARVAPAAAGVTPDGVLRRVPASASDSANAGGTQCRPPPPRAMDSPGVGPWAAAGADSESATGREMPPTMAGTSRWRASWTPARFAPQVPKPSAGALV